MGTNERTVGRNAAGRLFELLIRLKDSLHGNTSPPSAWQHAASIPPGLGVELEHVLTDVLRAGARELRVIETALHAHNYPAALITPYVTRLTDVFRTQNLHQNKDMTLQYLTGENLLALHWFSVILPDDRDHPPEGDLKALSESIRALEEALEQKGLPPGLRAYSLQLLESLKSALNLFAIQGTASLRQAVRTAVSEAHFEETALKGELDANKDSPATKRLLESVGGALKSAATITGDAEKLVKNTSYLSGKASEAITLLGNIFS